ncbi:MAG: DEAD/DEAH box helicase [Cyanobacteria bacterium]|nr:DEAD/DEAH box helicase [Cyanobacteriota bacterium]
MPGTLAAAARRFISHASRTRGESYFHSGRVTTVQADRTRFAAVVRGSRQYDVLLTLAGDRLVVNCTCPYFEGSLEPCKHIWAAILAADAADALHPPPNLSLDFDDDLFVDVADDVSEDDLDETYTAPRRREPSVRTAAPPPLPAWQTFLSRVSAPTPDPLPARTLLTGELIFVFEPARSAAAGGLLIELFARDRKKSGDWAKPRTVLIGRRDIGRLPNEMDRNILAAVCGADPAYSGSTWNGYGGGLPVPSAFLLNPTLQRDLVPHLCATGRLLMKVMPHAVYPNPAASFIPVEWDPCDARFGLRITGAPDSGYRIDGVIRSGEREDEVRNAMFVTRALILWPPEQPGGQPRFAAFDTGGADRWMTQLLDVGPVTVPPSETATLIESLALSDLAQIECPQELRIEARCEPPRPLIRITRPQTGYRSGDYAQAGRVDAKLSFLYGESEVDVWSAQPLIFDRERRLSWRRDHDAERAALSRLQSLGIRRLADWQTGGTRLDLAETVLPTVVRVLLAEGWRVEADGRLYRQPGAVSLKVQSGIDWFELRGGVDFDGLRAELPALLQAARRGDRFVPLGDGTFGLLPEDWLARISRIAAIGTPEVDHVRFARPQAALLDAWLATQPEISADDVFAQARAELAGFERIAALDPPAAFHGVLRDYQRESLGWFEFLRRFGFGGCLADEMGLGKTIMVLAALEARRVQHEQGDRPFRPSIVVVPRSLVFNWRQEAARFAPALRVLDFTGSDRRDAFDRIRDHNVVLTTYGTLRRDIAELKEMAFDYAILDEAQAIKNARTSAAKAARLLRADHRLALSGTPVENHLGELWSLFDFLNPGLLGTMSRVTNGTAPVRAPDSETLTMLARGLRPFILRRTKEQVAAELPARTEQTLYCDLEPAQRKLYDQLRDHYRTSLLGKIGRGGLGRAKLQILEALLRLRQAACHPALIDPARAGDPAAKLEMLLPRLHELVEDGRKVLVFSQFTTLLGLLRARLNDEKLAYEYLDGKTRDRQARVQRFQNTGCPLFLVSLKAGGLGLNLTAAEYVFLLDPWWNPAVEAQAIDRAHRIGQTRPVFAFRLIARDTVEEKVLELQATKRRLADAIVRADDSLIRDLRREDLELLLS